MTCWPSWGSRGWPRVRADYLYGQQKLLEFVRVLVPDPDLILLDEPFAGVNPAMEERLIAHARPQLAGKSFLVTDHEMRLITGPRAPPRPRPRRPDRRRPAGGRAPRPPGGGGLLRPVSASEPLLRVEGVVAGYGQVLVLHGVDVEVRGGSWSP